MIFRKTILWITIGTGLLAGCTGIPDKSGREARAESIARLGGMEKTIIQTAAFDIVSFERISNPRDRIRFYIEGDGYSWVTRNRASADPTPVDPVGLKLAAADSFQNVVYLARPCQYGLENTGKCRPFYWTKGAFSEEIVISVNEAIDVCLRKHQAAGIEMIGYSGGGTVAVLAAARRNDVKSIRTIAGNLDPEAVARFHQVSPPDSLFNLIQITEKIREIPQLHFAAEKDDVVPKSIAEHFVRFLGPHACAGLIPVPGTTHEEGWEEKWPRLLGIAACKSNPSQE